MLRIAPKLDVGRGCGYTYGYLRTEADMRFASVAEVKNQLSRYLARAREKGEPIIVTRHGRPYALIQSISERDLKELGWDRLTETRLRQAWEGEDDGLYSYL